MNPDIKPNILVKVRFFTTIEGGRETAIQGEYYRCPLFIDGEASECRFLLYGQRIELGKTYNLPVKFLWIENVVHKFTVGKEVLPWEAGIIGRGEIIEIFDYTE